MLLSADSLKSFCRKMSTQKRNESALGVSREGFARDVNIKCILSPWLSYSKVRKRDGEDEMQRHMDSYYDRLREKGKNKREPIFYGKLACHRWSGRSQPARSWTYSNPKTEKVASLKDRLWTDTGNSLTRSPPPLPSLDILEWRFFPLLVLFALNSHSQNGKQSDPRISLLTSHQRTLRNAVFTGWPI